MNEGLVPILDRSIFVNFRGVSKTSIPKQSANASVFIDQKVTVIYVITIVLKHVV